MHFDCHDEENFEPIAVISSSEAASGFIAATEDNPSLSFCDPTSQDESLLANHEQVISIFDHQIL